MDRRDRNGGGHERLGRYRVRGDNCGCTACRPRGGGCLTWSRLGQNRPCCGDARPTTTTGSRHGGGSQREAKGPRRPREPQVTMQVDELAVEQAAMGPGFPELAVKQAAMGPGFPELAVKQAAMGPGLPELAVKQAAMGPGFPELAVKQAAMGPGFPELAVKQAAMGPGLPELAVKQAAMGPGFPELAVKQAAMGPGLPELAVKQAAMGPGFPELAVKQAAMGPGLPSKFPELATASTDRTEVVAGEQVCLFDGCLI